VLLLVGTSAVTTHHKLTACRTAKEFWARIDREQRREKDPYQDAEAESIS
jgi:hypothetical protein